MRSEGRPRAYVAMAHPGRRARVAAGLRADGWVVRVADDGYDLVYLLNRALLSDEATARPDVLIVDATLNGVTGLSLLQGIRELQWTTPVIVLVDFNRPDTLEFAQHLGATQVMEKPADPRAVCDAARDLRPKETNRAAHRVHRQPSAKQRRERGRARPTGDGEDDHSGPS